ncbi:PhoH family protein, partial [Enterococcus faecalis]|uniref:PhoH family protein n=1 Tax=Enterococcus faecalis TaxID=1351 RepID=UPI0039853973
NDYANPVAKSLVGKNREQKSYINMIKNNTVTVGIGEPGTGKTFIPSVLAAQELVDIHSDAISIMRDGIKSRYSKDGCCAICGSSEDLELHHYHTISQLIKKFAKELQLDFTDENIVL